VTESTAPSDETVLSARAIDAPRSLRQTLGPYRSGYGDPTVRVDARAFTFATLTPDGPGTLHLRWAHDPAPPDADGLDAEAWGPGGHWLLDRVSAFVGRDDAPVVFDDAHPVVDRALRATRTFRIGATGVLYHHLLPTIIAQRITAGEALRQWARLCHRLGDPAPGPADVVSGMLLPPTPASLHRRPAWWFHPLGIETARARPLVEVARHPDKMFAWAEEGPAKSAEMLAHLPGVGPWTIGSVLGPALGDPDAVPVGDYHFANSVAWALAGEPRADDDRMLALLAPYAGHRGRVLRAVLRTEGHAPAYGPKQRILPMARW
jgi:3-methyladenine DNA glycosylase/8-oxoguanine DNA glycosylase